MLIVVCTLAIPARAAEMAAIPVSAEESTEVTVPETAEAGTEAAISEISATQTEEAEQETTSEEAAMEASEESHDEEMAESCVSGEMPLYFQTDYPNNRYGSGTIATNGCGITSLAMVATCMTGHEYLPDELADYFGGYGENNIQKLEHASDMLQLPWEKAENFHKVMAALKEGKVAILLMNAKPIFTESQHFIVLKGITEDGKILVNDPYAPNYDYWLLKNGFANGFDEGDLLCGYSGGWIYDVTAMPEDPFIYAEEKTIVEPRYSGIQLTEEERRLLAKVIWLEARGESPEGQQAIAEIVFNRMVSGDFPNTLKGVIYAGGQFRSVGFLEEAAPTQAQYDAIEDAMEGPYVLPIDVVHFATYPVNENVWGQIGGHIFCYQWGSETE